MPAIPSIARDMTVLGLDIGTNLIKVVEMRSSRGSLQLLNVGIRPTPPEVIANGVIVDPAALGTAIRGLLQAQGIRTREAVASVAGQSSLVVRPIEVPKMSRPELADTMRWEVERHIPFAASEVIMDYQPLAEPEELPEERQNMEVLLAVAQEDMINAYLATFQVAGLRPRALDIEGLAATRSLVDVRADDGLYDETIALVNVGATTTDISIIRDGLLSFNRPVPMAGDSLTNAISENLGRDLAEAERLKKEAGMVILGERPAAAMPPPAETEIEMPETPQAPAEAGEEAPAAAEGAAAEPVFDLSAELDDVPARREAAPVPEQIFDFPQPPEPTAAEPPPEAQAAEEQPLEQAPAESFPAPSIELSTHAVTRRVYEAMLPALSELVAEIRRSLEYYRSRYPDSSVDRIVLFGGTAKLENLAPFISNEIGIRVDLGDPLIKLDFLPPFYRKQYLDEVGCLLPIAVGLAIRDILE
ncbi:MAG: type IV pilus assembly protein PilM [Armatimonadota bacterium]|nr:MAG: type IV pilus assembly protein PilM [Armatimonadota bacterium]